jgi:cytochrome P450
MPLAMAELEAAFSGLLARLPGIKLAVTADQLQWSNPKGDVGLKSLPVTW